MYCNFPREFLTTFQHPFQSLPAVKLPGFFRPPSHMALPHLWYQCDSYKVLCYSAHHTWLHFLFICQFSLQAMGYLTAETHCGSRSDHGIISISIEADCKMVGHLHLDSITYARGSSELNVSTSVRMSQIYYVVLCSVQNLPSRVEKFSLSLPSQKMPKYP